MANTQYKKMRSYENECLELGVEFVGTINKLGRIEDYVCRTEMPLTTEKKEMFSMSLALHHQMQHDYDDDFEPVKYTLTERGNSKFISIPIFQKLIFIIMKRENDHLTIINKIISKFAS